MVFSRGYIAWGALLVLNRVGVETCLSPTVPLRAGSLAASIDECPGLDVFYLARAGIWRHAGFEVIRP